METQRTTTTTRMLLLSVVILLSAGSAFNFGQWIVASFLDRPRNSQLPFPFGVWPVEESQWIRNSRLLTTATTTFPPTHLLHSGVAAGETKVNNPLGTVDGWMGVRWNGETMKLSTLINNLKLKFSFIYLLTIRGHAPSAKFFPLGRVGRGAPPPDSRPARMDLRRWGREESKSTSYHVCCETGIVGQLFPLNNQQELVRRFTYYWVTGADSVCVMKVRQIPRTTRRGSNCLVVVILRRKAVEQCCRNEIFSNGVWRSLCIFIGLGEEGVCVGVSGIININVNEYEFIPWLQSAAFI